MSLQAIRKRVQVLLVVISLAMLTFGAFASIAVAQTDRPAAFAHAKMAADVLMRSYDPEHAWFPSNWWNSAVALQTIGDYMQRTGDRRYLSQLDNTFEKNQGVFPAGVFPGEPTLGNFTSQSIDDTEWWGLTWVEAYDLTGNPKYLDMAVTIANYVYGYWDTGTCGGGVWWSAERNYKNAVTNGLFIRLTAELHNRIRDDKQWLARSRAAWAWLQSSGMINANGLINDGLTHTCTNNGQTIWTYNQGLLIGAGLELWRATRDPQMLVAVHRLADAAIGPHALVTHGILTENCDVSNRVCGDDGEQFKGIFMRYWSDLVDTTHDPKYAAFLDRQAESIWQNDRDVTGRLGVRWSGHSPNVFNWRTQASALSALIGAIREP